MAFTEASNDGALNGTNEVTLVAAPSSGTTRVVKTIVIQNRDTASVTLTVRYKASSTRQLWSGTLAVGDTWVFGNSGEVLVLDATSKSITAVLGGSAATTNPDFVSTYSDVN